MNENKFQVLPFDIKSASPQEYAALNRHINKMRLERLPDDPPIPVEETTQNLLTIPSYVSMLIWVAWDPTHQEIIGSGNIQYFQIEENKHLASFDITILPEYRRQGLGRQFLQRIATTAQTENKRLLLISTVDRVPSGEAFMQHIGAEKGLQGHTNQLRLADLDRGLIDRWLEKYQTNSASFELGFWDGAYPEEKIEAVAELFELTNQQPFGSLEIEDMHMTPEQLRQMENSLFSKGNQRWTFYVIDRSTGKFAGYTETVWNPNRPQLLRQDMTGVFPEYRNRGLGRWLKASMLKKILEDRPQVKFIRTGNADTNAAMLKINQELGFQPYTTDIMWQVGLDKVLDYLQISSMKSVEEGSHA